MHCLGFKYLVYLGHMKTILPRIYEYNNFRKFLSDYQCARNTADPSFTKSAVSKMVGLPNTRSFFFDVLKGKRLSGAFIERFAKVLELTKDEAQFFRVLVMFNQAESPEERELYFDQLISLNRTPKRVIGKDVYSFYKNWYVSVIRALLDIYDFKNDYHDLAKKVFPEISVKQAKESIVLLQKLELIAKNKDGFYKPTEQSITTPDYVKDELIKQYQLSCFEMVKQSLVKTASGPQTISTNVISISDEAYKRIEKKIEKFRSEIRSLVHKDEKPARRVYQLDMALIPNSNAHKEKP
jgi:uncharacterized protein (TIGR02147 family)